MRLVKGNSIDICEQLESWYEKPSGQFLLQQECTLVNQLLEHVFGFHLLQLGVTRNHPLGLDTGLNHRIYAGAMAGGNVGMLSEPSCLPFDEDSIDVVVLHHALEFAPNPHALLREVHRILAPQGHIIVIGFNPLSLYGLNVHLRGLWPGNFWHDAHCMGTRRLHDWLHLLGAEVEAVKHCYAIPPVGSPRLFSYFESVDRYLADKNWPCGGVYAVRAQKHAATLTPTRLGWQKRMGSRLIGLTAPAKPVPSPREGDAAA
jgi:SAM-dependent methyltransferase